MKEETILTKLSKAFRQHADKDKSIQMAAYMKNLFPFYGIQKPIRDSISKPFLLELLALDKPDISYICTWLWEQEEREYQYFCIEILLKLRKKQDKKWIKIYEWLLLNKSWWDSVDHIAGNIIGDYFIQFPEQRDKYIKKWRNSNNIWLIRTTIIFQLKYKNNTDIDLLSDIISQHAGSNEFFIQKAIGWALRNYSYTDAKKVKMITEEINLKPLSKREALKRV
jgi:3-methyladenine DNA glycosylase AlkD